MIEIMNNEGRILKSIMERYGSIATLKMCMFEDTDVVLVNLSDDMNDDISEQEILNYIHQKIG